MTPLLARALRRPARRALLTSVAVMACAALPGCGTGKRDARALVEAVDAYRRAENPMKAERARSIERAVCNDADVCAAKEACVASSHATVEGLGKKLAVEEALHRVQADAGPPLTAARSAELASTLDDASHLLDVGFQRLADCDVKTTDLRLTYGL